MIYVGEAQGVSAFCDTLIDQVDWDRLEGEGHIRSGGVVNRERLLAPVCVDVFV